MKKIRDRIKQNRVNDKKFRHEQKRAKKRGLIRKMRQDIEEEVALNYQGELRQVKRAIVDKLFNKLMSDKDKAARQKLENRRIKAARLKDDKKRRAGVA